VNQLPRQVHQVGHTVAHGFWHLSPEVWTAIGTCVAGGTAVVALLVAVIVGLRQLGEARRLRREQAQPYVAVFIDETGTGIHQYNLALKNFGATAAKDVRVKITPPLRSANLRNSDAEHQLKLPDVIPVLVPGQQWDTYWDWSGALDEAKDLPRIYEAEVSFSDSRCKHVDTYRFVLDWEPLIARSSTTRYGIHHVADALRDIDSAIKRVTTRGGAIAVEGFDRDEERKRARRDRRRRERRYRVAGNSEDPASPLDRVLVKAEKTLNRLRSGWPL
jgi:hypothetical protein